MDKRYLKRNAALGLGNFKDERALDVLKRVLVSGEDEVRGYAAWAIGKIGGTKAINALTLSLSREKDDVIREEIESALGGVESSRQ